MGDGQVPHGRPYEARAAEMQPAVQAVALVAEVMDGLWPDACCDQQE